MFKHFRALQRVSPGPHDHHRDHGRRPRHHHPLARFLTRILVRKAQWLAGVVSIGFWVLFPCMIATMEAVVVAEHEWSVLQVHKTESPYKLMRRKSEAILMLSEGVGVDVVARLVERASRTVVEWVRDWRRDRLSSICTGHVGNNNASKISPEQEKEILEALSRPPSEQGIAAEFWNIHDLADWMHGRFDIEYASESSHRSLLHMAGLSFHLPEEVDRRRADETEIEARMAKIRAEIAQITGKKQDGREEDEEQRETEKNECKNKPFSPEPMAQGPGSARWCGKDGCGVGVARTGAAHLASLRTFPRHHANPSQSGGLPGEKGSMRRRTTRRRGMRMSSWCPRTR